MDVIAEEVTELRGVSSRNTWGEGYGGDNNPNLMRSGAPSLKTVIGGRRLADIQEEMILLSPHVEDW